MVERGRPAGRPRSEVARESILRAVDDLLVEVGYSALTMKGIADRAGVGRQTVYRWWKTKAEVLMEACETDAREELTITTSGRPLRDVTTYLEVLARFLSASDAGLGYRALLGEAQHDSEVASLLASRDVLGESAQALIADVLPDLAGPQMPTAVAQLVGPVFFWVFSGHRAEDLSPRRLADSFVEMYAVGGR